MPPIILPLRPSRQLAGLLAIVHGLAVLAIIPLTIPWIAKLLLGLALGVSAWYAYRGALSSSPDCLQIKTREDCELGVDGVFQSVRIENHRIVLGRIVVLALQGASRRQMLVLLPDSSAPQALRRLRVWLRGAA